MMDSGRFDSMTVELTTSGARRHGEQQYQLPWCCCSNTVCYLVPKASCFLQLWLEKAFHTGQVMNSKEQ
ncbi:hypothetical protein AV530_006063 [Patagioenas fasciata monilis]|uniref:Uncharacterized protein n=1 Tax=Patagioenas fasciata monilis TaxID=372326 RepID=A0A1V4J8L6_PATFA|nr:hypothetical protein AV530_006063 [Patagioenas fasciata monilis]